MQPNRTLRTPDLVRTSLVRPEQRPTIYYSFSVLLRPFTRASSLAKIFHLSRRPRRQEGWRLGNLRLTLSSIFRKSVASFNPSHMLLVAHMGGWHLVDGARQASHRNVHSVQLWSLRVTWAISLIKDGAAAGFAKSPQNTFGRAVPRNIAFTPNKAEAIPLHSSPRHKSHPSRKPTRTAMAVGHKIRRPLDFKLDGRT